MNQTKLTILEFPCMQMGEQIHDGGERRLLEGRAKMVSNRPSKED
jgi:hypothetical protein